jgi:hypothetical protein
VDRRHFAAAEPTAIEKIAIRAEFSWRSCPDFRPLRVQPDENNMMLKSSK